ncbi:ABC transporter ATP-binding protein [Paractinoplanes brasiliensis]|uniref:ABC-2 type transport system ATP-binding protein n=1 Tax=Paractinoplanes brasiliensis TaxID=52695 RepID=A0A4R6JUU5_9ACTN|nr:ABC transporter ATP-binding protein [Actinoplanes brasiliensis]TDO38425.1 ABC-2 type transport system ATP-binding protein [Actinoplanes brasiliensis]GID26802.1 ABC transporter ATP-binding protein [Actinoplanes brasiliensis]
MTELIIDVHGLVKRFGAFIAVDGLDLRAGRGEVHGFLGPNGAGKSTTIRVLLGLYRASAGRVRVLGRDPGRHAAEVTARVSYVPGEVTLWPNLTGQEVLDAFGGLRGSRDATAERRLADAFALDTRRLVRTYSKGNRQKVVLVAAFAARTDLLVLDEPTSGLDPLMEEVFQRCVRDAVEAGRTVLLSSHILAEVEDVCDTVTIIKDGRLVESGRLADMRHLAASTVTARLPARLADSIVARLRQAGVAVEPDAGTIRLAVPRDRVPAVLGVLADADADDITCTPAKLEDLFLRHYEVAAR